MEPRKAIHFRVIFLWNLPTQQKPFFFIYENWCEPENVTFKSSRERVLNCLSPQCRLFSQSLTPLACENTFQSWELLSVWIYRAAAVVYPSSPLSPSLSISVYLSPLYQPMWPGYALWSLPAADFTGCKVTCLPFSRAEWKLPGSEPLATCSRIMHMTYCTYIQQLFTRRHVVFMSWHVSSTPRSKIMDLLRDSLRQKLLRKDDVRLG